MKSLVLGSIVALSSSVALACDGHNQTAAATTVVAANTDKAAPAQKSETTTPAPTTTTAAPAATKDAAKDAFKLVSVDEVAAKLDAQKKDKKVAFAVFDANGKETRAKEGVIPTAVLLPSSSEYDLALLPKDNATPVVFYCANEKCTASHTAAKRAIAAGHTDVAVLGAGISGWVKAGKAVEKQPVG